MLRISEGARAEERQPRDPALCRRPQRLDIPGAGRIDARKQRGRLGGIELEVLPGERPLVESEARERGRWGGPAAQDHGAARRHLGECHAEEELGGRFGADEVDIVHHQHERGGQPRV